VCFSGRVPPSWASLPRFWQTTAVPEWDAALEGAKGALLRREGLYSVYLGSQWTFSIGALLPSRHHGIPVA
jgi:hypothetical protein